MCGIKSRGMRIQIKHCSRRSMALANVLVIIAISENHSIPVTGFGP
jgi:hypothetical protein